MGIDNFPVSSAEKIDIDAVKGALKPLQEKGVGMEIKEGKIVPKYPEGDEPRPIQDEEITNYLNNIAPELKGVKRSSIPGIYAALKEFTDDPAYIKDMVHYGPSMEDDFAKSRMARIKAVRDSVTRVQMESGEGETRFHSVKAATFVRSHIHEMGLKTTLNYLELLS